jgi:hypothetical protein
VYFTVTVIPSLPRRFTPALSSSEFSIGPTFCVEKVDSPASAPLDPGCDAVRPTSPAWPSIR